MDSGIAAWMLMATCLVFLLVPAIAFFYGGMVRSKSVLNMLTLSISAAAITVLIWVLWGWSIGFGGKDIGGIFGDPGSGFLLRDVVTSKGGVFNAVDVPNVSFPQTLAVVFQLGLAMFAVAIISGALAERVKVGTWMLFVVLWITFDYAPLAHMVWNGGILSPDGAISQALGVASHDLAGGSVIQINAAVAALVIVLIIGKRRGFNRASIRPHNVPLVVLGAFLLWFGWFGLTSGSAGGTGSAGYTLISTMIAAAAGIFGWLVTEKLRTGYLSTTGAVSGLLAGLVGVSPAADVISPLWALVLGLIVGVVCCFAAGWKHKLNFDDSLDVIGINGIAGVIGVLFVGFGAAGTGLLAGGGLTGFKQLLVQLIMILIVVLYSAVVTAVIAFALERLFGWRITEAEEIVGADLANQGERAYDFSVTKSSIFKGVK
jgi:Amt family ammonium transporter